MQLIQLTQLMPAVAGDLNQVVNLVNQAYRGAAASASPSAWTSEIDLISGARIDIRSLADVLADGETILLVAKTDDAQLQACVALRPIDDEQWYLSMLAVNPTSQSAGVGKLVLADAEKFAKEGGAKSIKISVINVRESLIAWYERRGYQKNGVVEAFPYDDPSVGTPLRDDLALVMLTKPLDAVSE